MAVLVRGKKKEVGDLNSKVELIIGERDERWWGSALEKGKKAERSYQNIGDLYKSHLFLATITQCYALLNRTKEQSDNKLDLAAFHGLLCVVFTGAFYFFLWPFSFGLTIQDTIVWCIHV